MSQFPDHAILANLSLIEEMYRKYAADPLGVDPSWRFFFEGMEFARIAVPTAEAGATSEADLFRRYGHLEVKINPIDPSPPPPAPELAGAQDTALRACYCSRIGFEFMHIEDPKIRQWFIGKIEPRLEFSFSAEEKQLLLEMLSKAEVFEAFIHTKYVGQKRFSIEGGETLIPMLAEIIERGADLGMKEFVIGMAHRGRLNVLTNILQKPYSVVFQEFEDVILPLLHEDSNGDVKYHKGFSSDIQTRSGKAMHLHLAANSSCLESVDPIVLGLTKAKLVESGEEKGASGAILIHGDAALSGQGVIYEIMEFMKLPGYSTHGTIHIAMNNQIGFTTLPEEGRSTRYCTDIALAFGCPVLHVNAEDPESCLFAAKMALEFRLAFERDIFIDLNCYRKYGHNEGDEPAFTQPVQYKIIRAKRSICDLYIEKLGGVPAGFDAAFKASLDAAMERGKKEDEHSSAEKYGSHWREPRKETLLDPFSSGAKIELLRQVAEGIGRIPAGFNLHPKLQKAVSEHITMLDGNVDWGMGESLAFGSLLLEKVPVRLTGQDSQRGTFSQRHAVWVDQETGARYCPLANLGGARFDVYNSPLSEYAALGFEYGYSWHCLEGLTLWEAQFGDFIIGAQIVIDHYLTTAEKKWARYSGLVLLLPHGYEGQGPEHSSGRIERFLQLCAGDNMQVANATTPAQYFHLLRRQALRPLKKPLIVFTPKSLLRHPAAVSPIAAFTSGGFQEVIADPQKGLRTLLCSGKVYYDLVAEREKRKKNVSIVRLEQLYPLHREKLKQAVSGELFWVQEEPKNMGAWTFLQPVFEEMGFKVRYAGRAPNPVTATGSYKQHKKELDQFMNEAFA